MYFTSFQSERFLLRWYTNLDLIKPIFILFHSQVGYHFNCWDPSPDPRFHPDTQLMIGPIPGQLSWIQLFVMLPVSVSLDHEGLYYNLRTNFEARGRVRFMVIHKVELLAPVFKLYIEALRNQRLVVSSNPPAEH